MKIPKEKGERFRWVVDYKGLYRISNCGRLWSERGKRIMRPAKVRDYDRVALRKGGRSRNFLVHRLVLSAFKGPPPQDKPETIHLDNDPTNNHISNLKWGSRKDNMAMDRGNNHSHKGEANRNSKLTIADVHEIRRAYDNRNRFWWGRRRLCRKFGISETHCLRIAQRKLGGWKHV